MTIVNTDSQIRLCEYQYKEIHPYTGMTNEYKPKDDYIYGYILQLPLQEVVEEAEA